MSKADFSLQKKKKKKKTREQWDDIFKFLKGKKSPINLQSYISKKTF